MKRLWRLAWILTVGLAALAGRVEAAERLCDPAYEDCRSPLIDYIRGENVGIDVAFWFMQDARYKTEILNRWAAGVPVRILVDPRANPIYPGNADIIAAFQQAGIPIRYRTASGILHWKTMVFAGQNVVEFDGANYTPTAFVYQSPYSDYEDESIYFSDDPSIVNSFKTKYDDLWLDTTNYANYANINGPLARIYPIYTKDPALNFPQQEDYAQRILKRYSAETQKIDVIMYRITDERHTNAMIAAMQRGVPVRLIGETKEYREPTRQWVAYNMDRLYAAGVPLRVRAHDGLNHQKLVIMYGQSMAVFGSSNWTTPSANQQQEHNYFTTKPWMFQWFVDQFERKWNNLAPNGAIETAPFVPLPPDPPVYLAPADGSVGTSRSLEVGWDGGAWGQVYDIYFGTDPNPPLFAANQQLGPTDPAAPTVTQKWVLPLLQPGTTYYWRIVSKTMAGLSKSGPVASFTTAGTPPPPPVNPSGASTIVLWTATDVAAGGLAGNWQFLTDSTAAGGRALWNPNKGASTISPPLAAPANYFQTTFTAPAGVAYHLWVRLRAQSNSTANNSVSVQFDDSIDQYGSPLYQIGTPEGAEVVLTDPSGTLNNWGWEDNGFGSAAPTLIYFPSAGTHTLQVQQRADGAIVDQIILSPDAFLTARPGGTWNDATIYGSTLDGAAPPPPPPPTPPPPPPVPLPWQQQDIGAVGMPGYGNFDGSSSTFTIVAAGADVWGAADAFHFVYQPLSGDGSIVARVGSIQNTNAWSKAGVMIRETMAPGAANAFMLASAAKGLAFQTRAATNGTTVSTSGPLKNPPMWVRLDRAGNAFTAYQSIDGVAWTRVGSTVTIPMAASVFVGLAVTSHNVDATTTSVIDHVLLNGTPTCGYSVTPGGQSVAAGGGSASFGIVTASGCGWTAVSSDPSWLTVAAASGSGSATVTATGTANAGAARGATVTVAGQAFTVSQAAAACTYTLSPASQNFAAGGGGVTIGVTTGSWCSWSAGSSDPSWLTVTSGVSGTGSGTVTVNAAANAAGARAGSVTIGDQLFAASQDAAACSYAISPASQSIAAGGGTASVAVTTGSWCSWSATSSDPGWLTVSSGASGSGNGSVALSAAANAAGARTATVAIADQTFTLSQSAAACSYSLSPSSASLANGGDTATFTITTGSWCSWSAASGDPSWLTLTGTTAGSGTGQVSVAAPQNNAGARSTTVTIGGQTASVAQGAAPCSYAISPAGQSMAAGGDTATVAVTTGSWCTWSAASNDPGWLTVTAGASGTANGTVTMQAAANTGGPRSGSVTIAGQTFSASQAPAACTYSISPATQTLAAGGDTATVAIATGSWCSWSASTSDPSWLTVTGAASGTGSGSVLLSAAANSAGARTATATIGGQTFTANQAAAACTFTLSPASQAFSPGGDSGSFAVSAGGWCSWTAVSSAPWLSIASGASGAGNGTVLLNAAANTGAARTATVTVGGQTFTGSQAAPSAPAGWSNQDIGAVGVAGGTAMTSGGGISVTGAGADVWGSADALQYAYQPLSGDGSIVARVATVQNVNAWTKAGVMIRETVDPGSAQAFMLVSPSKGLAFQRRVSTNGVSTSTSGSLNAAPFWVRIDRAGNTINAYQSPDGVVWALVDTDTIAMAANVLIGLGVSSHTTTATATATFDHVTITPGTPVSPTPLPSGWSQQDIGSVGVVGSGGYNAGTGTFVAKGSGADIGGTIDGFHFVYKAMTGDGVIVARVATLQNTNASAKAGVMIRETLTAGSTDAFMAATATKGTLFERRLTRSGTTAVTAGTLSGAPIWVKLERIGNTFNGYTSADGVTWTLVGSDTVAMAANVYVGFAVSSHTATAAAQATFDNVATP